MNTSVTGYTNISINGDINLETEVLTSVDLSGGNVTLTDAQAINGIIEITTGHASNAVIAPNHKGKMYFIVNNHATLAATIKVSGQTGVTVAATKKALAYCNGTDYVRLTADA